MTEAWSVDTLISDNLFDGTDARPFSADVAAAFAVVEEMARHPSHYPFTLLEDRYSGAYSGGKWLCGFGVGLDHFDETRGGDIEAMEFWDAYEGNIAAADTVPMAICLAALKALGVKVKED